MSRDALSAQVLAADEARYQALYAQDLDALARMLRSDYLHTHATGRTETKAMFLASIGAAKYRFVQAVRSDQTVRVHGPVAILSGTTQTTLEMAAGMKTIHNAFVTAWVHQDGGWQMLHWQATPIAPA